VRACVTVPEPQRTEIHDISREVTYGWDMIPVLMRVGGTVFETSLWPKDGGYIDIRMSVPRKR